jgi:hypothetical protein
MMLFHLQTQRQYSISMPCNQEHKRTTQEKTRAIMKYCSEKMEGKVEIKPVQ